MVEAREIKIEERAFPVMAAEKPLMVKEWFAAKKFREIRNSRLFRTHVFAIIGETEKAYNCMIGGLDTMIATWVPKSLVEIDEEEAKRSTFVCEGYTEAKEILDDIRDYWE